MIILIDNYDSFTWNLYHFLGDLGAETVVPPQRQDQRRPGDLVPARGHRYFARPVVPSQAGIIIDLIKQGLGPIPIFGVCLGLQAIGEAFGGDVVRAPHPDAWQAEQGASQGQRRLQGLPQSFDATRYHSLVVDRATLPKDLEITAETDGLIMGLQHKTKNVHGVQFHPESIASEHGHDILKNFLDMAE